MADAINLPINIISTNALKQINKFSKESVESIKDIGKSLSGTNKELSLFGKSISSIGTAAEIAGAAIVTGFAGRALLKAIINNADAIDKFGKNAFKTYGILKNVVNVGTKISSISKGILNFLSASKLLIGTLTAAFAGTFLLNGITALTNKATEFENALTGVNSVANNFGITNQRITKTVEELAADGLIPVADVANSLKNLLATGLNLDQSTKLFLTLKDAAAFGRQGFLDLGQAVEGATQGIKNGQSTLVDNAGITKNLSVLQKEYAESIGTTVGKLTTAQKLQAVYQGILREGAIFAGDAAKLQDNYTGATSRLSFSFTQLLVQLGEFITKNELIRNIIKNVSSALDFIKDVLNENKVVLQALLNTFIRLSIIAIVSANIIALAKAAQFLSKVIKGDLIRSFVDIPFPFLKKSLRDIGVSLGIATVSVKTFGKVFTFFSSLLIGGFKIAITKVTTSLAILIKTIGAFLLNPITIVITSIIAAFYGLIKAIQFIEERTGVFTELWNILTGILSQTLFSVEPLIKFFSDFGEVLKRLTSQIAGGFIVALSKLISFAIKLAEYNPFNIFNKDQVDKLSNAKDRLDNFSSGIINLNFDISKLKDNTARIVASVNTSFKKIDLEPLKRLQQELKDVGLTDKDKLIRERDDRLKIIQDALKTEGDAFLLAKELEEKINKDFNKKMLDLNKSVASVNTSFKKIDLEPLKRLQQELKDVGLTDKDKLIRERDDRLKIIQDALKTEGDAFLLAKELEEKINKDFNKKMLDLNKQANQESIEFIERIGSRFSTLSASIQESLGRVGQSISSAFSFAFGSGSAEQKAELDQLEEDLEKAFAAGKISEDALELEKSKLKKLRKQLETNTTLALGTGILNSFARGSAGATQMVTGLSQVALDAFVPGLGQAAGPLLDVFAQGPEATKQAFNEFAQAVPTVIENIILSIPAAIQAIADNIDIIIYRLVDRSDEIVLGLVTGLIKAAPDISFALTKALIYDLNVALLKLGEEFAQKVVVKIVDGIIKGLGDAGTFLFNLGKKIFEGLWDGLKTLGEWMKVLGNVLYNSFWILIKNIGVFFKSLGGKIFDGFWDGVKGIGNFFYDLGKSIFNGFSDAISSIGGSIGIDIGGGGILGGITGGLLGGIVGGNVGGVIGSIGGAFGFAEGGYVPSGFPNDTFPARLTSGEFVIDKSTTANLQEFLSNQSNKDDNNDVVVGLLSQLVSLMKQEQNINTTVDFRGDTLADIILNLNRTNARIA